MFLLGDSRRKDQGRISANFWTYKASSVMFWLEFSCQTHTHTHSHTPTQLRDLLSVHQHTGGVCESQFPLYNHDMRWPLSCG